MKVEIGEVKTRANHYQISGNLINGWKTVDGVRMQNIENEFITRQIAYINTEKGTLKCVCGREFLINSKLELIECSY